MEATTLFVLFSKDAILKGILLKNKEAIELYLESLIADNQPIPKEDLIW